MEQFNVWLFPPVPLTMEDPLKRPSHGKLKLAMKGRTVETSAFESFYGGQFTLSTQLIKPNYKVGKLVFANSSWSV